MRGAHTARCAEQLISCRLPLDAHHCEEAPHVGSQELCTHDKGVMVLLRLACCRVRDKVRVDLRFVGGVHHFVRDPPNEDVEAHLIAMRRTLAALLSKAEKIGQWKPGARHDNFAQEAADEPCRCARMAHFTAMGGQHKGGAGCQREQMWEGARTRRGRGACEQQVRRRRPAHGPKGCVRG